MRTFWPEIRREVPIKSQHGQDIGQDVHDGATSSFQFCTLRLHQIELFHLSRSVLPKNSKHRGTHSSVIRN